MNGKMNIACRGSENLRNHFLCTDLWNMVKPVLALPLLWRCSVKSHKCDISLSLYFFSITVWSKTSPLSPRGNPISNHPPSLHYHASVLQLHCWTWPCLLRGRSVIFQIQAACWYSADTQLAASSSWRQRVKVSKDTPPPRLLLFLMLVKVTFTNRKSAVS